MAPAISLCPRILILRRESYWFKWICSMGSPSRLWELQSFWMEPCQPYPAASGNTRNSCPGFKTQLSIWGHQIGPDGYYYNSYYNVEHTKSILQEANRPIFSRVLQLCPGLCSCILAPASLMGIHINPRIPCFSLVTEEKERLYRASIFDSTKHLCFCCNWWQVTTSHSPSTPYFTQTILVLQICHVTNIMRNEDGKWMKGRKFLTNKPSVLAYIIVQ